MPPNRWEKTKSISKKGFDKAWNTVDKLGGPVNRLSNKLGAEAFWPMTIDKEADKAARILRSFCKDGFYAPESTNNTDENGKINRPKGKQRVIKKIPSKVLRDAKGIAIFTTMRTGLWISGSGGSGVLLGRLPETGEWSPPSGIMLHTAGIGFLAGVDIYDCVVIINTNEALAAFKKLRCTLGGEVSAAAGPVGIGGVLESEVHKRRAPIWTYMKSKGLYAGVAIDGTIIIERTDENERFYGERISVDEILSGKVRHPPYELETLMQTLKAAQGDTDVDESLVPPPGETPGDLELTEEDYHTFGVPAPDDPDPYGVKALEAEGLFIREAGTRARPNYDTFEFRPNLDSPIYSTFSRRSADSSPRNSWRASVQSSKSFKSYISVDRGTQTDDYPLSEPTSVSRTSSRSAKESPSLNPWGENDDSDRWDTIAIHGGEEEQVKVRQLEGDEEEIRRESANACEDKQDDAEMDNDEEFEVHEVSNAMATPRESVPASPMKPDDQTTDGDAKRMSPSFIRARLVTIPARTPPALPPRHPQHIWGSGSSRESTSPTAQSHSSHNTSPTTDASEAAEHDEHVDDASEVSPLAKQVKTATAVPTVVDDDEKDEFLSANGDEAEAEDHTAAEDVAEQEPKPEKEDTKEAEAEMSPQLEKTPNVPKLAPSVDHTPEVEETLDKNEAKLEAEVDHPEGQKSNKSYAHVLSDREEHEESPKGTKVDNTLPHVRAD